MDSSSGDLAQCQLSKEQITRSHAAEPWDQANRENPGKANRLVSLKRLRSVVPYYGVNTPITNRM
jgi:hypothetical protein